MIHRVDSLAAALALAERLRSAGDADWFRGQVRNWPLVSSFGRRDEAQRDAALRRFTTFQRWLERVPELAALAADVDAALAVAQHYGLPTHLVDFSTEPRIAAFFAAHDAPSEVREGDEGCIICLSTADLSRFWSHLSAVATTCPEPEQIRVEVPELWRLQAQRGVFLHFPYDAGFERTLYDFDRIVFPAVGGDAAIDDLIPATDIYPTQRSDLEILLDQFFMLEHLEQGRAAWQGASGTTLHIEAPPDGIDLECFGPQGLPPHESWRAENLAAWNAPATESWAPLSAAPRLSLRFDAAASPASLLQGLGVQLEGLLAQQRTLRGGPVRWHFDGFPLQDCTRLEAAATLLWDGLRRWPFEDADVAGGLAVAVTGAMLVTENPRALGEPGFARDLFGRCLGPCMEVEIGMADGSYTRGLVSRAQLEAAVRPDFGRYLAPTWRERVSSIVPILQVAASPRHTFEFARLATLFARQIAATQVVLRGGEAVARLYNPARSRLIGLP